MGTSTVATAFIARVKDRYFQAQLAWIYRLKPPSSRRLLGSSFLYFRTSSASSFAAPTSSSYQVSEVLRPTPLGLLCSSCGLGEVWRNTQRNCGVRRWHAVLLPVGLKTAAPAVRLVVPTSGRGRRRRLVCRVGGLLCLTPTQRFRNQDTHDVLLLQGR